MWVKLMLNLMVHYIEIISIEIDRQLCWFNVLLIIVDDNGDVRRGVFTDGKRPRIPILNGPQMRLL